MAKEFAEQNDGLWSNSGSIKFQPLKFKNNIKQEVKPFSKSTVYPLS